MVSFILFSYKIGRINAGERYTCQKHRVGRTITAHHITQFIRLFILLRDYFVGLKKELVMEEGKGEGVLGNNQIGGDSWVINGQFITMKFYERSIEKISKKPIIPVIITLKYCHSSSFGDRWLGINFSVRNGPGMLHWTLFARIMRVSVWRPSTKRERLFMTKSDINSLSMLVAYLWITGVDRSMREREQHLS